MIDERRLFEPKKQRKKMKYNERICLPRKRRTIGVIAFVICFMIRTLMRRTTDNYMFEALAISSVSDGFSTIRR